MVQLKRFDMMRGGLKINKPITFTEELDLKSALSAESKVRLRDSHLTNINTIFRRSKTQGTLSMRY